MRKFSRSPVTFPGLHCKNHWLLGVVWPVTGSKGNKYAVEFTDKGFTCECTGFTMHGKCKHIQGVWDRLGYACSL